MSDTVVVGAATLTTRMLGFVRNAVVSAFFGQGWKADVLNVVFNLPMTLRKLVAEGAFSTAFIPVLSKSLVDDPSGARSKQLVRALFSLQIIVLVPFTILAIVFAPQIIMVLAPFGGVAEKQSLAIELFRWFISFLFLVSWSAVMMGVENTHQKFFVPAVSPLLFSVAVIGSLLLLAPAWGVYAQIPGVLLGGILPILMQWVPLKKLGYSMVPLVKFWIPEMKETLKKWGPALSVSMISLVNQLISTMFATNLHEGSASALNNAIVFWQFPAGVLSASVVTVYFPRMSRQIAKKDWDSASGTMVQGLEIQALLLIPAGLLMALFAEPIIAIAFQRGMYTYDNTVLAASVLSVLSWGLFLSGIFTFLQRYFYAKGDFKTPFRVCLLWAASDATCSYLLIQTPLGVAGLAYGSIIGFGVGATALLILAWRDLPLKRLGTLLFFWVRIGVALVPVWLAFEEGLSLTGKWWTGGMSLASIGFLLGEGLAGLVLFGISLLIVGVRPWKLWKPEPI